MLHLNSCHVHNEAVAINKSILVAEMVEIQGKHSPEDVIYFIRCLPTDIQSRCGRDTWKGQTIQWRQAI